MKAVEQAWKAGVVRLFRLRPCLWLLAVFILAFLVSFTWERTTSYDDGGFGTASFVILHTIGLPSLLPAYLFSIFGSGWWRYVGGAIGVCATVLFYLWLDRLTVRYVRRYSASAELNAGA